jgi:L-ascorbate metabolism protein UlaG (beta-lactamase superfamily)
MTMDVRLIRHATTVITVGDTKLLIDPMFSPQGTMEPAQPAEVSLRNPLVDLPCSIEDTMAVDAVLITHTHRDHLDDTAIRLLPKNLPLFCQPADLEKLKDHGFERVHAVDEAVDFADIRITRTGGQHGRGDMAAKMGPVSGFVLTAAGEPRVYLTGDSVWCDEVDLVLRTIQPDVVVAFAGGAAFTTGGAITMTAADIIEVCQAAPQAKVVAVHMEAWNHCLLRREQLQQVVNTAGLNQVVFIPTDGEVLQF